MWIAVFALAGAHACVAVDAARITMRDLAQKEARFRGADPALEIGFTPEPGSRRTFFPAELVRLAKNAGLDGGQVPFQPVCFERRSRILKQDDLLPAIRTWAPENARVEIAEWSRAPVPAGEVVLPPPPATNRNSQEPILLHGYVVFDGHRHAPIWVRARITVRKDMVVALTTIEAGSRSTADQFAMEPRDIVNDWTTPQVVMEQVIGKVARKRIPKGSSTSLADWKQPLLVEPGSTVTVDVRDGAARLEFEARAETGGGAGATVTIRNASSGKLFSARVTGENAGVRGASRRIPGDRKMTFVGISHRFTAAFVVGSILFAASLSANDKKPKKPATPPPPSALDIYVKEAMGRYANAGPNPAFPGSLFSPGGRLVDVTRDVRAAQIDDVVTILVAESASAVSTGSTKTARTSKATSSITALASLMKTTGPLANLANLGGTQTLDGEGTTSRTTTLTTSLTARVTHVLPNGYLVLEGTRMVNINSEHQTITVRGVIRPEDLTSVNSISSVSIADLEINVNGKGVVADATRRPNLLYRLLLGILPF